MSNINWQVIEQLYTVIESRKTADAKSSYTASLFAKGTDKIAQKLGEEAVETAMAAAKRDKGEVATESADLLYHLLVLWAKMDVKPQTVLDILEKRAGLSGLEEKNNRNL